MTHTDTQEQNFTAYSMLRTAGIDPTPREVAVLAADIVAITDEGEMSAFSFDTQLWHAANTLRERIGGYSQLRGYLNCLLAKKTA